MTQEEFAAAAGFSLKFYQQIEAGHKKQIWVETVERLAESYGLALWEFLSPDAVAKSRRPKNASGSKIHYK